MAAQRIISADSHFVEPPTMWAERMEARFRDRVPHIEEGYKGRPGQWFRCENIQPVQVECMVDVPIRNINSSFHLSSV